MLALVRPIIHDMREASVTWSISEFYTPWISLE